MARKLNTTAKAQLKRTARQRMNECDLSNLVSVDTSKHNLQKHKLKKCITVKKPLKKNLKAKLSFSNIYELELWLGMA